MPKHSLYDTIIFIRSIIVKPTYTSSGSREHGPVSAVQHARQKSTRDSTPFHYRAYSAPQPATIGRHANEPNSAYLWDEGGKQGSQKKFIQTRKNMQIHIAAVTVHVLSPFLFRLLYDTMLFKDLLYSPFQEAI